MNGKRKNILLITAVLHEGGMQKVTCILANDLAERHNVTVAYCFDSDRESILSEKCNVRKLPDYNKSDGFLTKARRFRRLIRELRALKEELDIEASVSLGNIGNIINALSKGKEQVICSERSNPKKSWGRRFPLIRRAFRRADFVVFQSEDVRSLFGPEVRSKSCILKNPVMIPSPAYEKRNKKIVSLGRLVVQKNHRLLIRSFTRFHERFPEYHLQIFGEGPLEEQTKELIADLQMQEYITLEGYADDVHERIRDAEMFVLSSDFEGLPNALLECMSMGIGCISTKCGGTGDVIRSGENGLLVEIGDEDAMVQAMCDLAENPQLRRKLERQAMEDMKAFDKNSVVLEWNDMILRCIEKTGAGEKCK